MRGLNHDLLRPLPLGVMGPGFRQDDICGCRTSGSYFFAAAARSTNVLPPFILWASGASLIWITTASASTPRFLTNAWVMSRIMPAFCSSVRPKAMLTVISGIVVSPFFVFVVAGLVPAIHDLFHQTRRGWPAQGRAGRLK